MRRELILTAVLLMFTSGCDKLFGNRDAIRRSVLQSDPKFEDVLHKHDEVTNRIALLNQELALKRSQVERQIVQLRGELDAVAAQVKGKVTQTKALLRPDIDKVDLALAAANDELKTKRGQRASLGRSINRIRKSLETQSNWTRDERAKFDHDLEDLVKETQRLDREIDVLTRHIELLKDKRELLKL